MSNNLIGFNIHAQGVKDEGRLLAHVKATRPAWCGVMDGVGLAKQLRAASPGTQVWHRAYPPGGDEKIWQTMTPTQWVDEARRQTEGADVWVYCLNEPGFGDDMLGWLCETVSLGVLAGLRLVVGNFSAGTPNPGDWEKPAARRLLNLLTEQRHAAILGLHEYAGAVITSGAGDAPGALAVAEQWPSREALREMALWHMGRHRFIERRPSDARPRILITEWGFDAMDGDPHPAWQAFLAGLPRPANGGLRGWRTLKAAWAQLYPQWSHEAAYYEALRWAAETIYKGSAVEGMQIYCYGRKDEQWASFDVEGARDFLRLLELRENPPALVIAARPEGLGIGLRHKVEGLPAGVGYRNLRAEPRATAADLGDVAAGDVIKLYEFPSATHNGQKWRWVDGLEGQCAGKSGWILMDGLKLSSALVTGTQPAVKPPAPPDGKEELATLCEKLAALLTELAAAFRKLESDVR